MVEITVQEGVAEASVRPFLDAEWLSIDPEPWTGGQCVIKAERDGTLVGVATCSLSAGVAHLSELMVRPEERNSGLGARLLAVFEEWAAAHHAHKLTLNTRRDGPAQRFYTRHGWQIAHVLEKHYLGIDYLGMVKWPTRP
jgi:GNAT superfamily N-acetyltransferase